MRWIGITGLPVVLVSIPTNAMDTNKPCYGLRDETYGMEEAPAPDSQFLLTDEQCDSMKSKELRMKLFETPQEGEDPMSLSLGIKGAGVLLRFKIPFSF